MMNQVVAQLLTDMGDLLELANDNPFRIRAFRRAAQTIEMFSSDITKLDRASKLEIPGIGKGIADIIEEFGAKGVVAEHEKMKAKFPEGVLQVMKLPGLGPKRTAFLYKELGIDSVAKLKQAATKGQLEKLRGFGAKTQENILKGISGVAAGRARTLVVQARAMGEHIMAAFRSSPYVEKLELAGSARRWRETVGDLDIICATRSPKKAAADFLQRVPHVRALAAGETKVSVLLSNGMQCDLRTVEPKHFGAALLYFTGSKEHNVRLRELAQRKKMTLNEYGLYKVGAKPGAAPVASVTEEDVYRALGLDWIPPELREDRGEIEAALQRTLPRLVEEKDILGDFHNHTDLSDGRDPLEVMVEAAKKRGWKWFFSGDHSPSLKIASGLPVPVLRKKMAAVRKLDSSAGIRVLCSSEVDILAEGAIDYPDDVLADLDCVVASVHSRFSQPEDQMTERVCRALRHPHVDILGHLTGRLINKREGYGLNIERVLEVARETQTAIEINGQPDRAELTDTQVKRAIELGVPLAVDTDAHSTEELNHMRLAVHIARRGWAEPRHLLNTRSLEEVQAWLNN